MVKRREDLVDSTSEEIGKPLQEIYRPWKEWGKKREEVFGESIKVGE